MSKIKSIKLLKASKLVANKKGIVDKYCRVFFLDVNSRKPLRARGI